MDPGARWVHKVIEKEGADVKKKGADTIRIAH